MLIRFVDQAGTELQSPFEAGDLPGAGEIVEIAGKEYEVGTAPARNVVTDSPAKMVRTVVLKPGPKATPEGARSAHGKKGLHG